MDYEKKYKEALEKAKDMLSYKEVRQEDIEYLFPELKELSDEKIREALIHLISEQDGFLTAINGINVKDIITWLEKQEEKGMNGNEREIPFSKQKPTDKVEPKFREGDIITHKKLCENNSYKIIQVDISDKKYRLEGGLVAHFSEQENYELVEQKHAWSEVDKDFMYDTLSNLTELKDRYGEGYGNVGKCIDWLKSLKERIGG